MARRYFSSTAVATTLSASANNSVTSLTVTALSGFPNSTPWTAIIDEGTASEEVVDVTNVSGTTLTVTRGVDGTTGVSHNAGATFKHGVSGRDFDEANDHVNDSTGVHGLGASSSVVGTSDSQTLTNKTINSASNTLTVAQSAVTNLTSDLAAKAPAANPTFTGVASFPDGSATAPSITNTGDTNTGILFPADDTVAISTGGSERARVDSSGRVQIGGTSTNPPRLYVQQAWQAGNGIAQIDTPSGETFSGITFANNGATKAYLYHENSGDRLWLASAGSGGVSLGYNATSERFRIDGNGLITGTGTSLGAWTSYTPTLGGTGWAIGNGTATGAYCQIGKVIYFAATITLGSTSTGGAGSATISVPVTMKSSDRFTLNALAVDTSATATYVLAATASSTSAFFLGVIGTNGLRGGFTGTNPFTVADTDVIRVTGMYEAA